MTNLDLSKAIWAGTQAIRSIPDYAENATTSDFSAAAVQAALPHILEALAVSIETDAQLAPDNAPDFHERYLAEKNIPKVRAFTALIRAKAAEARA